MTIRRELQRKIRQLQPKVTKSLLWCEDHKNTDTELQTQIKTKFWRKLVLKIWRQRCTLINASFVAEAIREILSQWTDSFCSVISQFLLLTTASLYLAQPPQHVSYINVMRTCRSNYWRRKGFIVGAKMQSISGYYLGLHRYVNFSSMLGSTRNQMHVIKLWESFLQVSMRRHFCCLQTTILLCSVFQNFMYMALLRPIRHSELLTFAL